MREAGETEPLFRGDWVRGTRLVEEDWIRFTQKDGRRGISFRIDNVHPSFDEFQGILSFPAGS